MLLRYLKKIFYNSVAELRLISFILLGCFIRLKHRKEQPTTPFCCWRTKYGEQNSYLKNLIHKRLNSEIVYCMIFLLKRKEGYNERFLSYLWRYYQNLLQQGLLFLLALLLFGCNNTADNNQTIANTQKVEVKSIKEYVNDNDFIAITPDVYANQVSRSSISIEEKQNLENQMVAATYRFYKHCIQDDKGRIFCNLTCGKNINISEELFQRKMKDIEETNKYVEKHLKAGTKYRVGKLDEKYLNSLLNYEAK